MQDVIRKHALLNAAEYSGKASVQSVMGKVVAELPEMVELVTVTVPPLFKMPPPMPLAELFERVEPETVSVPLLKIPPPFPAEPPTGFPPEMVKPEMVAVTPLFTVTTRLELPCAAVF